VLDPPWPSTDAALPYPKLGLEEIAGLPIPQLLNADAVVWLWTTNTFLFEAERLAREAWGLNYRNLLTWAKDRVGTGHWLRGQTEHCLLLTRGKPTLRLGSYSTLLTADVREHSRKPDEFYALVERVCPGNRLELFARQRRPGWQVWGSEPDRYPPQTNTNDMAGEAA
jgi:N6-adenosine-specific RNA methylase IME4